MRSYLYDFSHTDGIVFAEPEDLPVIGESVILDDGFYKVVVKVIRIIPSDPAAAHLVHTDFTGSFI